MTKNESDCKTITLNFHGGTLLIETDDPAPFKKTLGSTALRYDNRVPAYRCNAIHYPAVRETAVQTGRELLDNVGAWETILWLESALPQLRIEQKAAHKAWMNTKQGVVVMPTGTGKTEVALTIMRETGVSTLIAAPVRDLMYQWQRRILQGLGYDAGVIGDNIFNVRPVSVTTYDSACIHMETLGNRFKLIVFDECHHLPGNMRRDAALMSAAPYRLGLTATPRRSDGREKDLRKLIGPTVYELPLAAVRGGSLADYDVVRIPVHLAQEEQEVYNLNSRLLRQYMSEKNKNGKRFDWQDLMAETGKDPEARNAQKAYYVMKAIQDRALEKLRVLEDIFRLHIGTPIIVFTGSNAMARDISRRFLVPCLLNHCGKKERLDIIEGFRQGIYPVLVANQVLDEGVDLPEAKVAVVVGGQSSVRQAVQRLGRILRKSGHKRGVLYEVVCEDTGEVGRSRLRRKSDAYEGTLHRRL
ncbi:MAG: DEAD/DEAH box helicase family protein [Candidatus Aminicenantes bacterium]|nr:DEAD/DEAH box helicase family protein [Candidatus Aminicenantes bacterium]